MPRKNPKTSQTNGSLEQAMALLIQNQAAFMSAFIAHESRTEERFHKIERLLGEHSEALADLQNRLQDAVASLQDTMAHLPEAVRQKIGFKGRG